MAAKKPREGITWLVNINDQDDKHEGDGSGERGSANGGAMT